MLQWLLFQLKDNWHLQQLFSYTIHNAAEYEANAALWDLHASTGEIWIFWDECPREWSHQRKHGRTRTLIKAVWKGRRWPFTMFLIFPGGLSSCCKAEEVLSLLWALGRKKGRQKGWGWGGSAAFKSFCGWGTGFLLPTLGGSTSCKPLSDFLAGFPCSAWENQCSSARLESCELQLANTVSKNNHQDEKWG